MRVSTTNRMATAVQGAVTWPSAAAGYPWTNLTSPQRPFKPAKSINLATNIVGFDLGSSVTFDALAVIHTNAPVVAWQADDAPTFNSGGGGSAQNATANLTTARNPWNDGRYHYVHRLSPAWTRRYVSFIALSGTALDLAATWSVGGLWVGSLTESPDGLDWEIRPKPNRPRKDVTLAGGARSRSSLGNAYASLSARRIATVPARPAGLNDRLEDWLELERLWMANDYALVTIEDGDPAQGMVMRCLDDEEWTVGYSLAEAEPQLEELTGP